MILQPFAENSVRHGFSNLKGEGLLTIEFEILPEHILKCTLTDNGLPAGLKVEIYLPVTGVSLAD